LLVSSQGEYEKEMKVVEPEGIRKDILAANQTGYKWRIRIPRPL